MITEFGKLSLQANEEARISNLMYYVNTVRKYPFVVGISWWTINDYHSRYPGTHPDGYRSFGLVTENREKLGTYFAAQKEFCPLNADLQGTTLKLTSRDDFPAFMVKDYKIRVLKENQLLREVAIPPLSPGMNYTAEIPEAGQEGIKICIISAGGYSVNEVKELSFSPEE
jgi:beta-glucuronidase